MASSLVILNDAQLRQLAMIIHFQEAEAVHNIQFNSELELSKYLRGSRACYDSTLSILNAGGELELQFQRDDNQAPIALAILSYLRYSTNFALQTVRNFALRMNYLDKISTHANILVLAARQSQDPENIARLAEEASQYRNAMLEYTRMYQSPASQAFSRMLKDTGMTFDQLVQNYTVRSGYSLPFNELEDEEKIEVYQKIIEASGRGNFNVNRYSKFFGKAGIVMLILTAGLMVWDIFSSEHVFQTATHHAVVTAASVGGAMLGEVVGVAMATALAGAMAAPLFVVAAGIVGSILGAYFLGELAGWIIDSIFHSGGTAPLSTDGHRVYVTPMPDGETLARQIAHHDL